MTSYAFCGTSSWRTTGATKIKLENSSDFQWHSMTLLLLVSWLGVNIGTRPSLSSVVLTLFSDLINALPSYQNIPPFSPSGCASKGGHKNIVNTCDFFCGGMQSCMKNSMGCRHVQKTNIPCICQMILYVIQPWTTIRVFCMSVKYTIRNVKRRTTTPSPRHTLTVRNSFTL